MGLLDCFLMINELVNRQIVPWMLWVDDLKGPDLCYVGKLFINTFGDALRVVSR